MKEQGDSESDDESSEDDEADENSESEDEDSEDAEQLSPRAKIEKEFKSNKLNQPASMPAANENIKK